VWLSKRIQSSSESNKLTQQVVELANAVQGIRVLLSALPTRQNVSEGTGVGVLGPPLPRCDQTLYLLQPLTPQTGRNRIIIQYAHGGDDTLTFPVPTSPMKILAFRMRLLQWFSLCRTQ